MKKTITFLLIRVCADLNVTMQGDNDLISLATWTNSEYTYSIGVYEQSGITAEAMSSLVSTVQ